MWLVGVGGIYGYGCKEVYRFPHTIIPTPLVSVLFCSSIPTFSSFFHKYMQKVGEPENDAGCLKPAKQQLP